MFLSYFWPRVFLRLGVIESRALQPTKSECIAGRQLSWVSWFSERKKAEANAPAQIWLPSSGGSSAMTQWGGLLIFSCSSLPFPPALTWLCCTSDPIPVSLSPPLLLTWEGMSSSQELAASYAQLKMNLFSSPHSCYRSKHVVQR